jgi:hypothetical protein
MPEISSSRTDALGGACSTAPNGHVRNVQLKKLRSSIRKARDQLNALYLRDTPPPFFFSLFSPPATSAPWVINWQLLMVVVPTADRDMADI